MTEDHQNHKEKNRISSFVWGGTILVATAIIGFSVYIAVHNRQAAQQPGPPPVVAEHKPAPVIKRPEPARQIEEPEQVTEPAPVPEPEPAPPPVQTGPPHLQLDHLAGTLKIHVPFRDARDKIPLENTCYRSNVSPAMDWRDAPPGTQSFVVFMEKKVPDADEDFANWILFNIPANETRLGTNVPRNPQLPDGAMHANNDYHKIGYIGPCDPKGKFHYSLRVFALDTMLDLKPGVDKYDLIRAMNGHIIDAAEQPFIHYYKL